MGMVLRVRLASTNALVCLSLLVLTISANALNLRDERTLADTEDVLPKVYGNLANDFDNLPFNQDNVVNPQSQVSAKKSLSDLLNDPTVLTGIMVCSILLWAIFAAVLYNHFLKKPGYSSVPHSEGPAKKSPSQEISPTKRETLGQSKRRPTAGRRSGKTAPVRSASTKGSPKTPKAPKGERSPTRRSHALGGSNGRAVTPAPPSSLELALSLSTAECRASSSPATSPTPSQSRDDHVQEYRSRDRHGRRAPVYAGGDFAAEQVAASKKSVKKDVANRHHSKHRPQQHSCHSRGRHSHKNAHEHIIDIADS